ncbi:tripartite tricarboxylate transporter TctB family protein [Photobacterium sp. DNB23_23_1]
MINKLFTPIIFFVFGAFLLIYSNLSLGDVTEFGAAFMPALAGVGIMIFSIFDAVYNFKKNTIRSNKKTFNKVVMIFFVISLYCVLSGYLGFLLTGILVTAPLMASYARCGKIRSWVISILVVISIDFLFSNFLMVPLPKLFN